MRIWILGSQGLLGKSFKNLCEKEKVEHLATSHIEADITNLASLESFALQCKPSHIINCAAYTDVDGAEKDPKKAFAVNAEGPAFIAKIAKKIKAKLVHVSTDYVFDGSSSVPYRETDKTSPLSVYGKSKLEGENNILEIYPSSCIVRTSWLFGRGGKSFVSNLLSWLQQKESLSVVSDQRGSPTHCRDLSLALFKLMNEEGLFHCANRGDPSRYEIAEEVLFQGRLLSKPFVCKKILPISHKEFPQIAARPLYSALNVEKAEKILGNSMRHWKEAVKDFINEEIP